MRRALLATKNLRRICGFIDLGDIPSESTFSRAFTEFSTSELGNRAHDALVKDYLGGELIGHISRDSTAIVDREKPAKKVQEPNREFGHVPIIDKNARGKEAIPIALHEAERYKMRSSSERANKPTERKLWRQQRHAEGAQQSNPVIDVWGHLFIR